MARWMERLVPTRRSPRRLALDVGAPSGRRWADVSPAGSVPIGVVAITLPLMSTPFTNTRPVQINPLFHPVYLVEFDGEVILLQ